MYLPGSAGQSAAQHDFYDFSGTIATGGTAQLLLPQRKSCTHLIIANLSNGTMFLQFGLRRSTAAISSGAVSTITLVDAGFGFQVAPAIELLGGGVAGDPATKGATMPGWPAPFRPAQATPIMQASAISGLEIASITVNDGGAGYLVAPYVFVRADRTDPTGVGLPTSGAGVPILPGEKLIWNGTACPTSAISILGPDTSAAYTVKWMP